MDGLTPEMRRFIEEARAQGVTRCPIRDVAEKADRCPVDLKMVSPEDARRAVEHFLAEQGPPPPSSAEEPHAAEAGD